MPLEPTSRTLSVEVLAGRTVFAIAMIGYTILYVSNPWFGHATLNALSEVSDRSHVVNVQSGLVQPGQLQPRRA